MIEKLRSFLTLGVIGQLPTLPYQGNIIDGPGLGAFLNALALAAAPITLPQRYSAVTNVSTTALTLSAANAAEGIVSAIIVTSGGSANTNTTDTATNIINLFWPNAVVGATALCLFCNNNSGTMTLAGGTGVTISGTATIPTLALGLYRAKVTALANPTAVGTVATNTTTTSSATAQNASVNNPTSVINLTSATGVNANASWLQVTNTDGTTTNYFVTAVNSTAITVAGNILKNIASGAAVSIFNNTITLTRMFSTVTATTAA